MPRPRHTCLVSLLLIAVFGTQPARAADVDCAIKDIPADASFYCSWLRNREQINAVLTSRAWATLMAIPAVQQAWQVAQAQMQTPGSAFETYQEWVKAPENRQLADMLLDMVSDEVFVYGGGNVAPFVELFPRLISALQLEGFKQGFGAGLAGKKAPEIDRAITTRIALKKLAKNPASMTVPDIIIGFKLANTQRAIAQIKRLEKAMLASMEQDPMAKSLKSRLKWAKVGGGEFLTFAIDSKALEFDEQSIREVEQKPGEYDSIIDRIKKLQLTLSLGVRGQYVLVAIGETTAPIGRLGAGARLLDRPELKPLAKAADQRLTNIGYFSKAMRSMPNTSYFDVAKWLDSMQEALPQAALPPEAQKRLRKDLATLAQELKAGEPKVGAGLAFSFLTARGTESYDYDWSEFPGQDASKPLTILNHVGGDPLFVTAGRSKYDPQAWPRLVRWAKVAYGYVEDFAVPQMKPEERQKFDEFTKVVKPLLSRFDEVTGKMFLPALADGQSAFVIDTKLASKQWHQSLPATTKPVAVPEPALVFGVSDAELLQKAMGEYRTLVNLTLAALEKALANGTPLPRLPAPETRKIQGGALYCYALPAELGLDAQVLPNAALGDNIAALTLSQKHSERLLTPTPLKTFAAPLADTRRPLAGATQFDFARLVALLSNWSEAASDFVPDEEALRQGRTILEILGAFRGYASARYVDGGATVTHSETVFVDLK